MKLKILGLVFLILGFTSLCFAADDPLAEQEYSVNIRNDRGDPLCTVIPITTIRPLVDKIKGYSCLPLTSGGTETYIGIFDGTDTTLSGECFGEDETDSVGGCKDRWPRGKKIANGVVVNQGAFTDVQIYFTRE